jgi:DNA-directed RNA polymerase subunit M/transcription elongation factor TFIIS
MDIEDQFQLEHLFLTERKCRICGQTKDLIDGFYLTRKSRGDIPSSYSYECKVCTIKRIRKSRKGTHSTTNWEYPDW